MLKWFDRDLVCYVTVPSRIVTVEVGQDDINDGSPKDATGCAVHRAVTRATGADDLTVQPTHVNFYSLHRGGVSSDLPYPARVWIADLDEGIAVAPISFDLEVPA